MALQNKELLTLLQQALEADLVHKTSHTPHANDPRGAEQIHDLLNDQCVYKALKRA